MLFSCVVSLHSELMKTELRDYQIEMRDRLYEAWKRCRSVMVQMPMGTGKTHLMAEVIRERMAEGVLIVAHRIELIAQISEMLDKFGVAHGIIDRMTKDVERVTREHRVVMASVLINVDIFSEGFDCPEVEFIQLARPTLSLSKYLQQVGRGMRINSKKAYVMILDQVGMYQTFGMPTVERDWNLMFRGKLAGKGQQGGNHRFIIREEPELSLLNLEMVRIKRHGEKSTGMELFIQNGKYGVLNDGKVVCQAEFEKVKRLDNPYFAMGVYPYYVYKNRVDIIGMDGRVMRPGIYGSVKQDHDVFIGQDINGRADYWDAKGGRHYKSMPTFERIQRFEVAIDGEQIYMRQSSKEWDKPFAKDNVLVREKDYVIFGNKLVFLNDTGHVYEVCGYEDNVYVYIKWHEMSDNDYQYACVGPKGTIVSYLRELPGRLMPRPTKLSKMGLIPFFTSKAELGVRSRK